MWDQIETTSYMARWCLLPFLKIDYPMFCHKVNRLEDFFSSVVCLFHFFTSPSSFPGLLLSLATYVQGKNWGNMLFGIQYVNHINLNIPLDNRLKFNDWKTSKLNPRECTCFNLIFLLFPINSFQILINIIHRWYHDRQRRMIVMKTTVVTYIWSTMIRL